MSFAFLIWLRRQISFGSRLLGDTDPGTVAVDKDMNDKVQKNYNAGTDYTTYRRPECWTALNEYQHYSYRSLPYPHAPSCRNKQAGA